MLFSERLLGALNDVIPRFFGKHIEESAVPRDADDQILVILRVKLRVDQSIPRYDVVLHMITVKRIEEGLVTPTLTATPGDLSLVLPKRILDGIMEMIYALDKVAPGTANDDTLLYGVEVKFYNMEVELDENLESCHKGLYVIGDGSGVTHSLSHASASGVYVARQIVKGNK